MGQAQTVDGLTRFMSVTMICHPCSRASERERAWPMPLPAPVIRARRVLDTEMDIFRPLKQQTQGVRQAGNACRPLESSESDAWAMATVFERSALMRGQLLLPGLRPIID